MKGIIVFAALLCFSCAAHPCDTQEPESSVDDIVFNNVTSDSLPLDQQLMALYECRHVFAMIIDSSDWTPMHLVSGRQPSPPVDHAGKPVSGTVLIGFILDKKGVPSDPVVLKSDDKRLDEIALHHVTTLRFEPAKFKGKVVNSLGVQVYQFKAELSH